MGCRRQGRAKRKEKGEERPEEAHAKGAEGIGYTTKFPFNWKIWPAMNFPLFH
jgi:hypothetical protein